MEYIAIFYTHSGALKFDRYLRNLNISCTLMPVPRRLSSSCGIGARFFCDDDIKSHITEDVDRVFLINNMEYTLVFENQE